VPEESIQGNITSAHQRQSKCLNAVVYEVAISISRALVMTVRTNVVVQIELLWLGEAGIVRLSVEEEPYLPLF
jgi:hypothetical protein